MHKIEIYTKKDCAPCARAKNVLDIKKISYQSYEIGKDVSLHSIKKLFPDSRTVPIITLDGTVQNSLDDLLTNLEKNTL